MKIKLATPLLLAALLLFSCGDDDDPSVSYIGTWVAEREDITECNDGFEDTTPLQCTDVDCYRVTFNEDDTFTFQEGLVTTSGTWGVDGVIITFRTEEDGEPFFRTAEGVLQAEFLLLSFTDETTGCKTTYVMTREVVEENPDDQQ